MAPKRKKPLTFKDVAADARKSIALKKEIWALEEKHKELVRESNDILRQIPVLEAESDNVLMQANNLATIIKRKREVYKRALDRGERLNQEFRRQGKEKKGLFGRG